MANSYKEVAKSSGTNSNKTYDVSDMNYINISDLNALGINGDGSYSALTIASTDTSAETITLNATPSQTNIRIYRATSGTPIVDFASGSRVSESQLDNAYRQGLYAAQEVLENASTTNTTNLNITNIANSQLAGGITSAKLAGSITGDKLSDDTLPLGKLENMSTGALLGNVSGGSANPATVTIDTDISSVSGSDDTIPSAKAVKAYIDSVLPPTVDPLYIYGTTDARNSATTGTFLNWSEITKTSNASFIAGELQGRFTFASTGTYLVELNYKFLDNDNNDNSDAYAVSITKGDNATPTSDTTWEWGSTVGVSSGFGIDLKTLAIGVTGHEVDQMYHTGTLSGVIVVTNISTEKLSIVSKPYSGADASSWESTAVLKLTKVA